MTGTPASELLAAIPLFAGLDDARRADVERRCEPRRYAKGDVLWRAGDPGDEFVVVVSGELGVYRAGRDADERVATLRRGEYAGEIALLLDEGRSATVRCDRAADVLVLGKDDFRAVVRDNPHALAHLTELLSRRALELARRQPPRQRATTVTVVADRAGDGRLVAGALAAMAELDVGRPAALHVIDDACSDPHDLARTVEALPPSPDAALVVVLLPPGTPIAIAAAASDVVVAVDRSLAPPAGDDARTPVHHVVVDLAGELPTVAVNHCEPFVLRQDPQLLGRPVEDQLAALLREPRRPTTRVLRRLTRKVLGATVGLALGGGAAFGIAHVGVLLALEEADIPVDLVAGTSMGSIVAIGLAAGLSPGEMVDIARRLGNVRTTLSVLDPTLTGTGFLSGRRLVNIFAPLLRFTTFEELELPCRVVAMDVETGERVDIGTGRLDDAFRASCSIPLVFTPVRLGGRTLVDGGMVDPVPADVARAMGADITVAVNVVPRLERGATSVISRAFKRVNRLNPLSYLQGARDAPDVVDVLMNSLQVVQYELGTFTSLSADVALEVELGSFTWIEFYRALEIIEQGRVAGEQVVGQVRDALDARLGRR